MKNNYCDISDESLYQKKSYFYHLPPELIAQYPCVPRDRSKLLVVDRKNQQIDVENFSFLADFLKKEDSLVFNDTKVIPARFFGKRESGGKMEIFLSKQVENENPSIESHKKALWEVLLRPGRKAKVGEKYWISDQLSCEVKDILPLGIYLVEFQSLLPIQEAFEQYGNIPLPPYIRKGIGESRDKHDYQTMFAKHEGSFAAPTAALHFTPEIIEKLESRQVALNYITLHVGLGTFKPITCEDIRLHQMHYEEFHISAETALQLNHRNKIGRQICVGTTTCRGLESNFSAHQKIKEGTFKTNIFIYPGYQFNYVDALLTNFHLPESSLLMLVSAFAGYDLTMRAYEKAVKEKFRFFSYGDAMLII